MTRLRLFALISASMAALATCNAQVVPIKLNPVENIGIDQKLGSQVPLDLHFRADLLEVVQDLARRGYSHPPSQTLSLRRCILVAVAVVHREHQAQVATVAMVARVW